MSRHDSSNPARNLPAIRRTKQDDLRARVRGTNRGMWPAGAAPRPPALRIWHQVMGYESPAGPAPAAVYGQYPAGFLRDVLPILRCEAREILHVCSGSLSRSSGGMRVDLRQAARPDVRADGRALPIRDGTVAAILIDPPYTADYAASLYGVEYPLPSHLLREAARVVRPCGRIGFVHFSVPYPPPGCALIKVLALSTGCGYQIRAVTIFEREQDALPGVSRIDSDNYPTPAVATTLEDDPSPPWSDDEKTESEHRRARRS